MAKYSILPFRHCFSNDRNGAGIADGGTCRWVVAVHESIIIGRNK